eukprot:CAMPEP_0181341490 /NCGR_PEP_ID=MMETSP1101-20121128/30445_1 /TAXON_ID=46948 /ORGANISM="Rhodomonas abbreviata, Strain Caron Lab Isolate" /LENGTH=66 /DNA_ID=CAMNT_0023452785 /DNA_START=142 /DNA_END=342 /DNA_ORIENTATION=-
MCVLLSDVLAGDCKRMMVVQLKVPMVKEQDAGEHEVMELPLSVIAVPPWMCHPCEYANKSLRGAEP